MTEPPTPELMRELLSDQAGIVARLDQLEAGLLTTDRSLVCLTIAVIAIAVAVSLLALKGGKRQ